MEKGICAVQARQENNSCEIMLWLLRLPQRRSLHEVCGQLKTDKSKPGSPSTGDEKLWTDGSNEVSWPRFFALRFNDITLCFSTETVRF